MFEKNLNILEKNNKILAERIKKISIDKAQQTVSCTKSKSDDYVLVKNGVPLEDMENPAESVKHLYFETIKNNLNKYDFLILFGLGIGHLLDYSYTKSFARLIVYEPDLNIIRFVMEYVDLTKYLSDERVFITDNLSECADYVSEKYLLKDKIEFLYLKNYVVQKPSEFTILTQRLYDVCEQKIFDMNTIKKLSKHWTLNTINSLSYPILTTPFNLLENIFEGKTALILGAGPSLRDNIELIYQNRDKYIIFAVGRTLETLRVKGIIPDFAVFVDARWMQFATTKYTDYLSKCKFITDIRADNYAYMVNPKEVFTYYPQNNRFTEKLQLKLPTLIKPYQTAGTAVFCAYNCARITGCKNIIFAGLDLAFKNDIVYCDNVIAAANTQNSVNILNVTIKTTTIKSVTGETVQTRKDYANFVKQFETLIKNDKTSTLYNISDFGAYIHGIKYDSLQNILEKIQTTQKLDIESEIQNRLEKENFDPQLVRDKSIEIIRNESENLAETVKLINDWMEMFYDCPVYFTEGTKIISQIPATSILSDYFQIEFLQFTKMLFESNDEIKKKFLFELFKGIKNFCKHL